MRTIQTGARAIGLLVQLNWDRIFFVVAIYICLALSAYVYSL